MIFISLNTPNFNTKKIDFTYLQTKYMIRISEKIVSLFPYFTDIDLIK